MTAPGFWARLERLERADPDRRPAVFMLNESRPFYGEAEKRLAEMQATQSARRLIVYRSEILPNSWPAR